MNSNAQYVLIRSKSSKNTSLNAAISFMFIVSKMSKNARCADDNGKKKAVKSSVV